MRIQITKPGIYGADGKEVPVGTELTVSDEPKGWRGRYSVLADPKGKKGVTNPDKDKGGLKAEHHGGGKFNITKGEEVLLSGLSKVDADAFNALSDEDREAFVADQNKG